MNTFAAYALMAVFASLSLLHLYWVLGGRAGLETAIPSVDGKPAFQPSAMATAVVAVGLALCGVLVAVTSGVLAAPISRDVLVWPVRGLVLLFLLRAVGDFWLVGFFKRMHTTRFARLDSTVYSPLCLMIAIGLVIVGFAETGAKGSLHNAPKSTIDRATLGMRAPACHNRRV
jgi:TctA family transporter